MKHSKASIELIESEIRTVELMKVALIEGADSTGLDRAINTLKYLLKKMNEENSADSAKNDGE